MNQRTYTQYRCAICDITTKHCCKQCQGPFYCSKDHQKQHWKMGHNLECNKQSITQDNNNITTIASLFAKRQEIRSQLIKIVMGEAQLDQGLKLVDKLLHISDQIYQIQQSNSEYYEYLADTLFIPKLYIQSNQMEEARSVLIIQTQQIYDILKGVPQGSKSGSSNTQKTVLLVIANLFNLCGDFKNCEKFYGLYIEFMEKEFGVDSDETADSYFELAMFYLENKYPQKCLQCLSKSHNIRVKLHQEHESVADCLYYMGLIHSQQQNNYEGREQLNHALQMRRRLIGHNSEQAAQCLEMIAKIEIADFNYRSALLKLEECYLIRKRLYQNDIHHPNVQRISDQLINLLHQIRKIKGLAAISTEMLLAKIQQNITEALNDTTLNDLSHFQIASSQLFSQDNSNKYILQQSVLNKNAAKLQQLHEQSNDIIIIDKQLLSTLNIEQLQKLQQLNNELATKQQNVFATIFNSQFLRSLSHVQFEMIKQSNEVIFESEYYKQQLHNPFVGNNLNDSLTI